MADLLSRTRDGRAAILTMLLVVVGAIIATALAGPFILVDTLITGSMWALVAAGLALVFGVMNIPNFAQGELFMVGSLSGYFVYSAIGEVSGGLEIGRALLVLGISASIGFLLGVVLDRLVFAQMRYRDQDDWIMNTFVVTIGISVILINGHQLVWGSQAKGISDFFSGSAVQVAGIGVSRDRIFAFLTGIAALVLLWILLRRTPFGRQLRAVAQDSVGAQMMGINVQRVYTVTLGLGSGLAALAGGALLFLYPASPYVGVQPLYIAWTVVILAGLGNVGGALISGFIVALFQTCVSYFVGAQWNDVITFALIITLLLIRPSGVFSRGVKSVWEQ